MLKDFPRSDLLWQLYYDHQWSQEANDYMFAYIENLAIDISGMYLVLDDLWTSISLFDIYRAAEDYTNSFEQISISLWLIYDFFATNNLILSFEDTLQCLTFACDSLNYLSGKNPLYTDDYDLVLYLNHYTTDDYIDLLREFARDDFKSAELGTLVIDKMRWKCKDIEFNEDKAVWPEKYIPAKEYITEDSPIE